VSPVLMGKGLYSVNAINVVCISATGLPPGVVNIVFGTGSQTGEAIVTHPGVQAISFTGSTVVGKRIQEKSAPFVKKLSLEVRGVGCSHHSGLETKALL